MRRRGGGRIVHVASQLGSVAYQTRTVYGMTKAVPAQEFSRVPEKFRKNKKSAWGDANAAGMELDAFLEGPSFDRAGNLYVTDIPFGRVFRISPAGEWTLVTEYDGEPNGLKIHKDGRIFITDYRRGLMVLDPCSGKIEPFLSRRHSESFKGVNDLFFASNGDLYFTDQGQSALEDPTGRVFRLRATGELDLLFKGFAGPNGLVLSKDEKILYVAETRRNRINSLPLLPDYEGVSKCGIFIQLSGSPTGPDGMALDEEGNLAIVHAGFGTVWIFSRLGEPLFRIQAGDGVSRLTNAAYGGPDRKTLYICDSYGGRILTATLPVAGVKLFSHL